MVGKKGAERRLSTEGDEQQVAGDDRRQNQRHMHDCVEQRLSPKRSPCEQQGKGEAQWARHGRRDRSEFPQNHPRPISKAMAMPNGNAPTVETAATRSDNATAVQSWGDRSN